AAGTASSADTPEAVRALEALLAAEDAEAERLLRPLLGSPAIFRRAGITALPFMRTAGIVRTLCAEARQLRERQPMHALLVADAAIAIADQLSASRYPAALLDELRGNGWYERANVLRYLGRYPEALDALDVSARAFGRSPVSAFTGAIVDYLRSVIYVELDRSDDARRLARTSASCTRRSSRPACCFTRTTSSTPASSFARSSRSRKRWRIRKRSPVSSPTSPTASCASASSTPRRATSHAHCRSMK